MSLLLEYQPYQNVDVVSESPEYQGLSVPVQRTLAHLGIEPRFNDDILHADMTSVTLEGEERTEHQYDIPHVSVVNFIAEVSHECTPKVTG